MSPTVKPARLPGFIKKLPRPTRQEREAADRKALAAIEALGDDEDAEIREAALADPDALPRDVRLERKRGRPRMDNPKVHLTLRLDADVVAAFKAGGEGWQTRINNALRSVVGGRR